MSVLHDPAKRSHRPGVWRTVAVASVGLVAALGLAGFMATPFAVAASSTTVNQCNGVGPGPKGATTGMTCKVTVVNTISGTKKSSTTTVFRKCSLAACRPGDGTFTTHSASLVTRVTQCNGSDNDSAHPITCDVTITNNISAGTHDAKPLSAATVNQCVGSAKGGGARLVCDPHPASTTGATVTECNGSGNGGGGTVNCAVSSGSRISAAIPITVNQCNGTGNPGGSVVRCRTVITTHITAKPSPSPSPSATATPVPTSTSSVFRAPPTTIQTGGGSTSGLRDRGLLALGVTLLMLGAAVGLLRWRIGRHSR
jgi:hypothetical protein